MGVLRVGEADEKEEVIRFRSYNIHNGRNGGLDFSLCVMYQANIDLGVFQETNLNGGIYARELTGYRLLMADAPI